MALDTTVGGVNANSWADLTYFNAYAAARLPAVSWFATATNSQKEAALMAACRDMEACFLWTGVAASDTQALTWPRKGMLSRNGFPVDSATLPNPLKDAQCEFALQLGAGDRLGDNDPLKKGITSLKAGSVALTFSDVQGKESNYESADVQARKAQSDLAYLSDVVPAEVRRLLVASWFTQNGIRRPILFETMGETC
jgi:hypothetical protein